MISQIAVSRRFHNRGREAQQRSRPHLLAGIRKDNPANREAEELAKNILKAELKRRGVTYGQLSEKLANIGVMETERNLNNKISRGGFSGAFFLQCLEAIGVSTLQLSN